MINQQERLDSISIVKEPFSKLSDTLKPIVNLALEGRALPMEEAALLVNSHPDELDSLCNIASLIRDQGKGNIISFSPKIFIPLTMLCRDFCGYCTFRKDPLSAKQLYMTPTEVLNIARAGEKLGCTEALFTLGERPELRYPEAKKWLLDHGYKTTIDYLNHMCELVLQETSLFPHGNPGTMSGREMIALKQTNVSMGVMLENISPRLSEADGPHALAPSKWPKARLKTIKKAGELKIPFTTGILIGIGETKEERIKSLIAIRDAHDQYGHIQEVIIQNFRSKPDIPMRLQEEPTTDDLLWTVAVARIILGPKANIQVPPNLSSENYPIFLLAGINDWGGVSPLTIDFVNPEAPWPQLPDLLRNTTKLGFNLKPRLPLYPEYITERKSYLPKRLENRVRCSTDKDGYVTGGIARYV